MFASAHSEHLAGGHSRSVSLISNMICSCICPHRLDGCYWFGYDSLVSAAAVSAAAVSAAGCSSLFSVIVIVPLILYVVSPPPLSLLSLVLSLANLFSRVGVTEVSLLAFCQDGWLVERLL